MDKKKKSSGPTEVIESAINWITAVNTGVRRGSYYFRPCIISSKPAKELVLPIGWSYSSDNDAIISGDLYIKVIPW